MISRPECKKNRKKIEKNQKKLKKCLREGQKSGFWGGFGRGCGAARGLSAPCRPRGDDSGDGCGVSYPHGGRGGGCWRFRLGYPVYDTGAFDVPVGALHQLFRGSVLNQCLYVDLEGPFAPEFVNGVELCVLSLFFHPRHTSMLNINCGNGNCKFFNGAGVVLWATD